MELAIAKHFFNELGYHAIYKSDRYGFKNPDEEWDRKENLEFVLSRTHLPDACVNTERHTWQY